MGEIAIDDWRGEGVLRPRFSRGRPTVPANARWRLLSFEQRQRVWHWDEDDGMVLFAVSPDDGDVFSDWRMEARREFYAALDLFAWDVVADLNRFREPLTPLVARLIQGDRSDALRHDLDRVVQGIRRWARRHRLAAGWVIVDAVRLSLSGFRWPHGGYEPFDEHAERTAAAAVAMIACEGNVHPWNLRLLPRWAIEAHLQHRYGHVPKAALDAAEAQARAAGLTRRKRSAADQRNVERLVLQRVRDYSSQAILEFEGHSTPYRKNAQREVRRTIHDVGALLELPSLPDGRPRKPRANIIRL
jgi:hypothetical protein